jgi:hypothetical protein
MGKTRLAIELCKRMRARGWRAGFLGEGVDVGEILEGTKPALVAIDYAESKQDLGAMLKRVAQRPANGTLRVLLLARNADEWWADLLRKDGAVEDLLRQEEPRALSSVTPDREVIFREAVRAFAEARHGKAQEGAVPNLTDPRYQRVLYVHAAALATVEGDDVKIDSLMEKILDHEERFWREQLPARGDAAERRAINVDFAQGGPHVRVATG